MSRRGCAAGASMAARKWPARSRSSGRPLALGTASYESARVRPAARWSRPESSAAVPSQPGGSADQYACFTAWRGRSSAVRRRGRNGPGRFYPPWIRQRNERRRLRARSSPYGQGSRRPGRDRRSSRTSTRPRACRALIQIWAMSPLVAIGLDVHQELVHHRGDSGVLEALMRHDMGPMAGGVADREEDGAIAGACFRDGLCAPLPPVDGIVLVQQQIGIGLLQAVRPRNSSLDGVEP